MAVSKREIAMVLGGLTGGYLSDDEGFGTLMGIGVGAAVGYHWKIVEPDYGSIISYHHVTDDGFKTPLSDIDRNVELFHEKLRQGGYMGALKRIERKQENAPSKLNMNNLHDTLSEKTLVEYLKSGETNKEDIIKIRQFMDIGDTPISVEDFDNTRGILLKSLDQPIRTFGAVDEIDWEGVEYDKRFTTIKNFMESIGHTEEEATNRATMLMENQNSGTRMEIDFNRNTVSIDGKKIRVSGIADDRLTHVYSDGASIYAGRRLNLFGEFLGHHAQNISQSEWLTPDPKTGKSMLDVHVDNFIKTVELEGTATEGVIRSNMERWMTSGMLAEEVEMLTLASPKLSEHWEKMTELASKGREFLQEETGLLRSGVDYLDFLTTPTKMLRDESSKTVLEDSFIFKKGTLVFPEKDNMKQLTKGIDTQGQDSSLNRSIQALSDWTGIDNIKANVGINDVSQVNMLQTGDPLRVQMSPAERGGFRSRGSTPFFAPSEETSSELRYLGGALAQLIDSGVGPEVLGNMQVQSRLSVDQNAFNATAEYFKNSFNLGDGFGYGLIDDMNSFRLELRSSETLKTRPGGKVLIAPEISNILENRSYWNVGLDDERVRLSGKFEDIDRILDKEIRRSLKGVHLSKKERGIVRDSLISKIESGQISFGDYLEKSLSDVLPNNKKFQSQLKEISRRRGDYKVDSKGVRNYHYADDFTFDRFIDKSILSDEKNRALLEDLRAKVELTSPSEGKDTLLSRIDNLLEKDIIGYGKGNEELRAIQEALKERNRAISGALRSNEVLGIDESGRYVRVPTIAGENVRLDKVVKLDDDYVFHFIGDNQVQTNATIKYFGPGSKANIKHMSPQKFKDVMGIALKTLEDSTGLVFDGTRASIINEAGTSGQEAALNFVKTFSNQGGISSVDVLDSYLHLQSLEVGSPERADYLNTLDQSIVKRIEEYKGKFSGDILSRLRDEMEDISQQFNRYSTTPASGLFEKVQADRLWGLAQALNSVSEGKATTNAALGLVLGGLANANRVLDSSMDKLGNAVDTDFAFEWALHRGDEFSSNLNSGSLTSRDKLAAIKREARVVRSQLLEQYNTLTAGGITEGYATGTLLNKEMLRNFQSAHMSLGVDYMFSQARPDETAYGGTGKGRVNLSHFAVSAYKSAGFDENLLSSFATMSDESRYDFTAYMKMGNHLKDKTGSLNEIFSENLNNNRTKIDNFLNAIAKSEPELLKSKLRSFNGFDTDANKFLMLDLGENFDSKTGIRSIPIYLTSTNYGGFTEGNAGQKLSSTMNNLHWDIVRAWVDYNDQAKQHLRDVEGGTREALEGKLEELQTLYDDMFKSKSNAWAKQIFSRQTENSLYAKVIASGDHSFNNAFNKYYLGIDSMGNKIQGAETGQRVVGLNYDDSRAMLAKYLDTYIDAKDFERYIDDDGILHTVMVREESYVDKKVRHLGAVTFSEKELRKTALPLINWREPTYHASSALVHVMNDEGYTRKGEIVVSVRDRDYTKFMLGDMDDDHIFLASAQKQLSPEELEVFHEMRRERAKALEEIRPIVENLGVKGGSSGPQMDIVKAHKMLIDEAALYGLTEAEARDLNTDKAKAALEKFLSKYDRSAMEKASLRKIVTPFVTNMIVDMLNDPNTKKAWDSASFSTRELARTIGNYVVEDVIKAAHLKTGEGAGTAIQELLDSYNQYTQALNGKGDSPASLDDFHKKWNNALKNFADNMTADLLDPKGKNYLSDPNQRKVLADATKLFLRTAKNPSSQTANSVMAITSALRKGGENGIQHAYSVLLNSPLSENLPLEITDNVNSAQTFNNIQNVAKSTIMDNIKANKMPLAIGAGVLGLGAIMSRGDPDFNHSNKGYEADSELNGMTLAGNTLDTDGGLLQRLGRENSGYVLPPVDPNRLKERAMEVYGGYNQGVETARQDLNSAIFGNNLSTVRVEQYNTLY